MSSVLKSQIHLSYPLYACDFDPYDAGRLVVGGGGGASRTGVGNKISLLNATSPDSPIGLTSEVELSKEEDNITSLAVGQHKGRSTLVYAGVNSSPDDQKKGKNEHFRVYTVDQVSRTKSAIPPKITQLVRASLFSAKDIDTYQRLLRLSAPLDGSPQVGACATGLSKEPQIALFDVSATGSAGPKTRGKLELAKDPVDMDIIQTGDDKYQLAYCDEYDLYLMNITKGSLDGPQVAYTITAGEWIGSKIRPSFRSLRYLTPGFIIASANLPKRAGAVIVGFRLLDDGRARVCISAKLPKSVTQTTGMAVRNLSPMSSPSAKLGTAQFVVAVAGTDHNISLYSVEHQTASGLEALANLYPFHTLKNVHELQITGLAFSHFHAPAKSTARTQYLKLASVSVKNTVVVHHIPLKKVIDKSAPARRAGPPRPPRYVVALKGRGESPASLLAVLAVGFLLLAMALQGVLEIKGLAKPWLGAHRLTPARWHTGPAAVRPGGALAPLLAGEAGAQAAPFGRLVLRESAEGEDHEHGIAVTEHDEDAHGPAAAWEELPPEQRAKWRARLEKAGHWSQDMGETVFKGILFSEIAGAVGGMLG